MSASFGPVQAGRPRYGECVACWDENHHRLTGALLDPRPKMVCRYCKRRLAPAQRALPQFRLNAVKQEMRERYDRWTTLFGRENYWMRRALLPDCCGEPGELSLLKFAGFFAMSTAEAAAVARSQVPDPRSVA